MVECSVVNVLERVRVFSLPGFFWKKPNQVVEILKGYRESFSKEKQGPFSSLDAQTKFSSCARTASW